MAFQHNINYGENKGLRGRDKNSMKTKELL